ncbi:MAG: phospho-N-acetylmuramoyl-pentapeptide-transferase [Cytophagaceae bacterium]|jgi:phospho-N-acetylmuramoyl-pentapeptide-transferase|nr:phospho-N-acetylmuramoyl-pentapeptide-transferase [Cytophagaceae bacterium]
MLFTLFEYLKSINIPGAGMFQYITFRSAMAVIFALLIATVFGKRMIRLLQRQQIGEVVRDLGLEGQYQKKGTPTMGGIIIITSILIPVLLFARLSNIYIILMLVTTVWLGVIGFLDDYIKVFRKNKEGLAGRFKIIGQVGLGLIIGLTLYFSNDVKVRVKIPITQEQAVVLGNNELQHVTEDVKAPMTNVPFFKNSQFNYSSLVGFLGEKAKKWGWVIFVLITIFIITAVSNGANITDGLDGLATGVSSITGITLGIFAYLSGHVLYADYLNVMYIPNSQELVVFMSAFIGACVGFLWYNSFPAQVFMGDTGSLTIGGIIAVFAILIRIELLIPILCGVFLVENISVMMQVGYFKYTKKRFGTGRRIFRMAPLHHHYQLKGYTESKIVVRFWIISIILAVLTIVTLKVR